MYEGGSVHFHPISNPYQYKSCLVCQLDICRTPIYTFGRDLPSNRMQRQSTRIDPLLKTTTLHSTFVRLEKPSSVDAKEGFHTLQRQPISISTPHPCHAMFPKRPICLLAKHLYVVNVVIRSGIPLQPVSRTKDKSEITTLVLDLFLSASKPLHPVILLFYTKRDQLNRLLSHYLQSWLLNS